MESFERLYERAVERHGVTELEARIPEVKSARQLARIPDDRWLAGMAKRVFAAGFRWKVIDAKWAGFEEAFDGFDPHRVARFQPSRVEALGSDTRIVRNGPKILATLDNAAFVLDVIEEHGSFGRWVSRWPADDTVGLWAALKEGGARLGGDTGPRFLRSMGRDTFILTPDVCSALVQQGVVDKKPGSKKSLLATQDAFNRWAEESGRSLAAVSMVLACGIGAVHQNRN